MVYINDLSIGKRISILREYREVQYYELKHVVYQRREWNEDSIPTLLTIKRLKIDTPEVLNVLKVHGVE